MKKIKVITFHASYNYGSNLQAYALQEYLKKLTNYEYKIINLRTPKQKRLYTNVFEKKGFKNYIIRILLYNFKNDIYSMQKRFEDFIQNKLDMTEEFTSLEALKEGNIDADYFIAGSDQLWNLQAPDFDWSNYLEFVKNGKKISYAASFGPKAQSWNEDERERIKKDLLEFDYISVREQGSFNNVNKLTNLEPEINVDPTMLLNKEEWEDLISDTPLYNKKYIFLYNLKSDKNILKLAREISKKMKLPVIISNYSSKYQLIYGLKFKKVFDVGPIEYLNLIQNAELVLSSSFHGTIFSILLQKPFFAINGNKDYRINTLLEKMNLENRSISIEDDIDEKIKNALVINFEKSEKLLVEEREKSANYLKRVLEVKE